LLVVDSLVVSVAVDVDEVGRVVVVVVRVVVVAGVAVARGVVVADLVVVAARGDAVARCRAFVAGAAFVPDPERRAVVVGAGGAGARVGATADAVALGGVSAEGVVGTADARAAAPSGTGTPMATAVPPVSASAIRTPRPVAATAGSLLVEAEAGVGTTTTGRAAGRIPSASTARTSLRSSTVSKISMAGFPPQRPRGAISSPFMRKESGASTAPSPIVTP